MRPMSWRSPEGRPRESFRQVAPPSSDLWIPPSGPPATRRPVWRRRCHDEAYTMSGFRGSRTTSLIPVSSEMWRTRSQLAPPSVVW